MAEDIMEKRSRLMSRGKLNMRMGLAILLLLLSLTAAVGISLARYRAEHSQSLYFTVRQPGQLYLGTMSTADEPNTLAFDHRAVGSWKQVEDELRLEFTVANGTGPQDYSRQDQSFSVQLVGGLGIWDGTDVAEVTLRVRKEGGYDDFQGTAARIQPGSPLYKTYGDGWVYSFLDEAGAEVTWPLEGSRFSQVDMTVILQSTDLTQPSLLQPVITSGSY